VAGELTGGGRKTPCELALVAALDTLVNALVVAGHYFEKHEGHPNDCGRAGCRFEDYDVWRRAAADEVKATLEEDSKMFGGRHRAIKLILIRGGKGKLD
jgi:hypothetical protein